jgi:PKD repeat protein
MKKLIPLSLLGIISILPGYSQTTPCVASSDACDEYITSVTVGAINNTGSACAGYISTGMSTNVYEGSSYNLFVTPANPYEDDEIGAWVDWNDDGDFSDINEDILYAFIDLTTTFPVGVNFSVPAGTTAGPKTLRVRISYSPDGAIDPCGTSTYGEIEDYILNVAVPSAAPVADFAASATLAQANNTILMTDLSTDGPTSWAWSISPVSGWSFAGGTDATSQHPQILFTSTGLYTIELTATNSFGSDTETKTDYVEIIAATTPACIAGSLNCDEYISNVTFGAINNTTGCNNYSSYLQTTDISEGSSYNISINADTYYSDDEVAIYIDWNNDGDFTDLMEQAGYLLVDGTTIFPVVMSISVPAGTSPGLKNMRVKMSYEPIDGTIDPCAITDYGEAEDYLVNVLPTAVPVADFIADATTVPTAATVSFTDLSTNVPTSWAWTITPGTGWSYAGGTSASSQNPQVTFTVDGLYTIELTATNGIGPDTETKTDYIEVATPTSAPVADFIASATAVAPSTAVIFTDLSTDLPTSWAWVITPATGWSYTGGTNATSQNPEVTFTADGLYTIELTASNIAGSDTETKVDYIEVQTPVIAPVADFAASATSILLSETVTFTDLSTNTPTSWTWTITPATGWTFAGGTNANSQNPQVTFNTAGLYTIELAAINTGGSDIETKTDYITVVDNAAVSENATDVLTIYPNPTNGSFVIQSGNTSLHGSSVTVSDITGRMIFSEISSDDKMTIDLSTEPAGIYVVQIYSAGTTITEKVIRL